MYFLSCFCVCVCQVHVCLQKKPKKDLLNIISVATGRHACCVNTFHTSEDAA